MTRDYILRTQANVRFTTGVECDNAWAVCSRREGAESDVVALYTDFRYIPMAHRVAPGLKVRDVKRLKADLRRLWGGRGAAARRIGFEKAISVADFDKLKGILPRARFTDVSRELQRRRAVKSPEEVEKIRAAVALNDEIWRDAQGRFRPGMTEREMASVIRTMMFERGDGEAFETIVCVGANAAECHHVPDGTVWSGREPVLVDMGVRLGGYCSDMTRNIVPRRASRLYRKVYALVLEANCAAIAAAKPGMTGRALDKVARDVIRKGGFGKCFGHSLGHGVGIEVHESPVAAKKSKWTLKPGMFVTIEPGIYLEGNLGVRIEDLIMITEDGCEVLTQSPR